MDYKVILLSGMPASGKDTITLKLIEKYFSNKYVWLKKFRSISENDEIKDSYFNISTKEFEYKILQGEFIQYHQRYNRYYGVSKATLNKYIDRGQIPIIHVGRLENIYEIKNNVLLLEKESNRKVNLISILLWAPIGELSKRIKIREKTDVEIQKRIKAVYEEFEDNLKIHNKDIYLYDLLVKNIDMDKTCRIINDYINKGSIYKEDLKQEFSEYLSAYKRDVQNE